MRTVSEQAVNTLLRSKQSFFAVFHRVALTLLGSYAFTWAVTAFGMAGLSALGVDFHEAETAMLILAFVVILPVFLWAFSARNLQLVWLFFGAGTSVLLAGAWGIQQLILA